MKKLFLLVIALLIAVSGAYARTFALASGISNYGPRNLNMLAQSTKDAKSMAALWKASIPDVSLLTGSNANTANIKKTLSKMAVSAGPDDQILYFFSGHGGKNVICLYDQNYEYYNLLSILSQSKCKNILVIIDACESGSLLNAVQKLKSQNKWRGNIACIVSSRASENSIETPIVGAGFLAQGIMKGFRGKADANGDRKLTVKELFNYAFNDVTTRAQRMGKEQHPQLLAPKTMQENVIWTW